MGLRAFALSGVKTKPLFSAAAADHLSKKTFGSPIKTDRKSCASQRLSRTPAGQVVAVIEEQRSWKITHSPAALRFGTKMGEIIWNGQNIKAEPAEDLLYGYAGREPSAFTESVKMR